MARPPRIEFPGAFYHVIVRGNQKQNIFVDDEDRSEYLGRLRHYKEERGFILYAYVLMTNHVHLLIETPKAPLSRIMQLLNFTYTRQFNRKYGKVGHLFQGRYKSFLCDRDEYLLGLVRYIHLNPVRAKIVTFPYEYRWSSHHEYLGKSKGMVDTEGVLRLFSEEVSTARKRYREFMAEAGRDESFYGAIDQQIVGDEKFMEKVGKKISDPERRVRKPPLAAIVKAVEEHTGVGREQIISRSRSEAAAFARGLLVSVWREVGHKMVGLQPMLKRDLSTLSKLAKLAGTEEGQKAVIGTLKKLNSRFQA
jgi:REP element-mobilizing transposase RayT